VTKCRTGALLWGPLCVLVFMAGCTRIDNQPSADTRTAAPTTAAPTAANPTTAAPTTEAPTTASPTTASPTGRPRASELLTGLTSPWGLIALKDGTFLISERDTKQILRAQGSETDTLRTIEDAQPFGEGGLLGLAITADESRVFAYYTAAEDNRIVAMSWDGRSLGEPEVILDGIPKAGIHDGGRIIIGPDGHLYVGTGDSGESQEAQDKSSLGGKILRITVDGEPAPGNPFGDEVFSFGHRNVQGLAFDEEGRLWASEFGSQAWDELNLIEKGKNYGWPLVEGSGEGQGLTNPKVVWQTSEASPSGLAYWQGDLWMAGLRGERLWQIPVDGTDTGDPVAHFEGEYGRLRTVVVSSDGQSLLLTGSNTDGRGDVREGDDRLWQVRLV
jgi:glucose/arabinose dehydrogenase